MEFVAFNLGRVCDQILPYDSCSSFVGEGRLSQASSVTGEQRVLATVSALVRHLVETQQLRSGRAGQAGGQTSMSELKGSDF